MKLKSFGCSFVFGTDLHDDGRNGLYATGSKFTFPALIAQAQGIEYMTYSRPGASNLETLARLYAEIATGEPAIYMINWTYIDRFGYTNESIATKKIRWNPMGWTSIMPVDTSDTAQWYYRDIHSQLRDKFETLNCIKSAIDAIRASGAQFVMTWIDPLIWETAWHCPPAVAWLQDQIRPWLSDFAGMGFLDWSQANGFEISDTKHPLEKAHRAAADLLLTNWQKHLRR